MPQKRSRIRRKIRVGRRRLVAWADRHLVAWLGWVPSWGTSLLVHGLAILMLALYLYAQGGRDRSGDLEARFSTQLTEDLNSLVDSNRAGDPFTRNKTDEPPSLSLEPDPASEKISQPEIRDLVKFAPDLAGPQRAVEAPPLAAAFGSGLASRLVPEAAKGLGSVVTRLHSEDMSAPFSGRDEMTRARLVQREGGTVHSEKAVENGLSWLIRHQRADGGWSLEFHAQCSGQLCPPHPTGRLIESDTGATGLALLPLLGAGHIHTKKSRYQSNVRDGLGWLLLNQQPTGELFTGGDPMARMYSHAISTMAICEAYGLSQDEGLRRPAQKAVDFIIESQNSEGGGWRYFPGQPGDTSVFGWQMFALRSARLAGLRVSKNVNKGCKTYLDSAAADPKKVTYSYTPDGPATPVMTAEALLSRQYLGWPRDYPPLVKGAAQVARNLEENPQRNIYYWYYATQLLHNMQGEAWKRWNVRVRDGLVAMQVNGDGCDRGSWDPANPQPDRWAGSGGRLFLTSLSVLTLEVYYRYLPLYQPTDLDRDRPTNEPIAAEPKPGSIAAP
jgi:hypothetical protein